MLFPTHPCARRGLIVNLACTSVRAVAFASGWLGAPNTSEDGTRETFSTVKAIAARYLQLERTVAQIVSGLTSNRQQAEARKWQSDGCFENMWDSHPGSWRWYEKETKPLPKTVMGDKASVLPMSYTCLCGPHRAPPAFAQLEEI